MIVEQNAAEKMVKVAGGAAGQTAKGVRRVATATGGKVKGGLRTVLKRGEGSEVDATDDEEPGGEALPK